MNEKEMTFKGNTYKMGSYSYNRNMLNPVYFKLYLTEEGYVYAYSKLDHLMYRTHGANS